MYAPENLSRTEMQEHARQLLAHYQPLLGLSSWSIAVQVLTNEQYRRAYGAGNDALETSVRLRQYGSQAGTVL